jgi:hypothetical protein
MIRNDRKRLALMLFVTLLGMLVAANALASYSKTEKVVQRVTPEQARTMVEAGEAVLVCSYGDDSCKSKLLEGALLQSAFEAELASMPKDKKIIFYCG